MKKKDNVNENYLDYVAKCSPKTKQFKSLFQAFLVGGLICCIGQFLRLFIQMAFGLSGDELSSVVSVILIFFGAFLTGLGVYDRIGKVGGGGSIVPITGFANSIVSPAMEFKSEGFIYGLASKMFLISGPIIVFGITSSALVGIIYFIIYNI